MSNETLTFSGPENMGGKGLGVSPEDLLIAGVTTRYSGTLFAILKGKRLAVDDIKVKSEGIVTGYPSKANFSQLIVHPTIIGAEESKQSDYEEAARMARDKCFIGQTIIGNVDYEVGTVKLSE